MATESGHYPPGAEFDPNAPWNRRQVDDEDEEADPLDDGDAGYDQEKDDAL